VKFHITPDTLVACYELLCTVVPFKSWNLPPSDAVKFRVTRHKDVAGCCDGVSISISEHYHGHLSTLLATMSHEMIHLYGFLIKERGYIAHGAAFKRRAEQVCTVLGFDPKVF